MKRDEILEKIAIKLWDDEAIDQNNYNFNFEEFRCDFLRICSRELDGIIFVKGEIIE